MLNTYIYHQFIAKCFGVYIYVQCCMQHCTQNHLYTAVSRENAF